MSFAAFLREAQPYIDEFRRAVYGDNDEYTHINHVTGEHWTLADLEEDLDKGFELVASKNPTEQEAGAELITGVAKRGRVAALLLYATHMLADSGKKDDIDQAKVWIHAVFYEQKDGSQESIIARSLLQEYYDSFPDEGEMLVSLEDKEMERYASFPVLSDEQPYYATTWGEFVHGLAMIGSIKIVCGWFKKLEEYVVKEDTVVAYIAPCLPIWYCLERLKNLIGKEQLNNLAGVILYSDDEDVLPPVCLQYSPAEESPALTHFILQNTYINLAYSLLVIRGTEARECTLVYNEDDDIWVYSIPEEWDGRNPATQSRLIQQVNSQIFKIAKQVLPKVYAELTKCNHLPKGECYVTPNDGIEFKENSNGGVDVYVTYHLIKYPEIVVDNVLLSCYEPAEDAAEIVERAIGIYESSASNGNSTTISNIKLYNKKPKYYPGDFNIV